MIVWCEWNSEGIPAVQASVATLGVKSPQQISYFLTPVKFTRWLFEQPRGAVTPWATLVVGWREAKPCVSAIEAAVGGDTSKLRQDLKRPLLQDPHVESIGNLVKAMGVAVGAMIIKPEKAQQHSRALKWAWQQMKSQDLPPGFRIDVANDDAHLAYLLDSVHSSRGTTSTKAELSDVGYSTEEGDESEEGEAEESNWSFAGSAVKRVRTPSPDFSYYSAGRSVPPPRVFPVMQLVFPSGGQRDLGMGWSEPRRPFTSPCLEAPSKAGMPANLLGEQTDRMALGPGCKAAHDQLVVVPSPLPPCGWRASPPGFINSADCYRFK